MEGTILKPFDDGCIGNIKQFKHEVILTSGTDYKVIRTDDSSNCKAHKNDPPDEIHNVQQRNLSQSFP
ncbi:MAG: hypothetical protein LBG58_11810 [Planctomycetaceae bacterium]|jgi:hypothetical protein|nr:hypothetical protein [Planctomycetaceae bacterium]